MSRKIMIVILRKYKNMDLLVKKYASDTRGYSLIELLVTMAILGILAGVAVTAYIGVTTKAARSEAYSNLETLRLLQEQFYAESGDYTGSHADVAAINGDLPGFQPGNARNFDYSIITDKEITTVDIPFDAGTDIGDNTNCFVAVATGISETRVDGDIWAIDCNNDRNF